MDKQNTGASADGIVAGERDNLIVGLLDDSDDEDGGRGIDKQNTEGSDDGYNSDDGMVEVKWSQDKSRDLGVQLLSDSADGIGEVKRDDKSAEKKAAKKQFMSYVEKSLKENISDDNIAELTLKIAESDILNEDNDLWLWFFDEVSREVTKKAAEEEAAKKAAEEEAARKAAKEQFMLDIEKSLEENISDDNIAELTEKIVGSDMNEDNDLLKWFLEEVSRKVTIQAAEEAVNFAKEKTEEAQKVAEEAQKIVSDERLADAKQKLNDAAKKRLSEVAAAKESKIYQYKIGSVADGKQRAQEAMKKAKEEIETIENDKDKKAEEYEKELLEVRERLEEANRKFSTWKRQEKNNSNRVYLKKQKRHRKQ